MEKKRITGHFISRQSKWRFGEQRQAVASRHHNIFCLHTHVCTYTHFLSDHRWPPLRGDTISIFWQNELPFGHFLFWLCTGQQNFEGCTMQIVFFPVLFFFPPQPDTMTEKLAITQGQSEESNLASRGYEFLISSSTEEAAATAWALL